MVSRRQHGFKPISVLGKLTDDWPPPRLLQITVCDWLKGDRACPVLCGLPVDRRYIAAVWTSNFEVEMVDRIYSNSIICLAIDLHRKQGIDIRTQTINRYTAKRAEKTRVAKSRLVAALYFFGQEDRSSLPDQSYGTIKLNKQKTWSAYL